MALPANIRVNVKAPFPALVYGTGPITVTKANGIWTIGYNPTPFPIQTPPLTSYPNDYVLVWDSVAKAFFQLPLSALYSFAVGIRVQRSIKGAGDLPIVAGDSILNINALTDLAPSVPLAASRLGAPLTFKNLPGSHLQTLTRTGADTFDGAATLPLNAGAAMTLVPYNDGVNAGWAIE